MRFSDIVGIGIEYLELGLAACLLAAVLFGLWYFFYFRKKRKGEKLKLTKVLVWGIFIIYTAVVLGATMLSRGGFYGGSRIYPLFYSYRDAWVNFTDVAWRNIILNILMFVPLGMLLPNLSRKIDSFYKVYAIGFLVTLLIEIMQLLSKRGIFEPDDLLGNTVGAMIGYGIYRMGKRIVQKKKDKALIYFQIPLFVTVLAFSTIFLSYYGKELGNLRGSYVVKADNIMIQCELEPDDKTENAKVYRAYEFTPEEAKEKATAIFARLGTGIDESRTDVYDESVIYYSFGEGTSSNRYSIWFDYKGGTYEFTDFIKLFEDSGDTPDSEVGSGIENNETVNISEITEEVIRKDLENIGITVPKDAILTEVDDSEYSFEAALLKGEGCIYDGFINCSYSKDGYLASVDNHMMILAEYKEYPIMSEEEVLDNLRDGQFSYWREDDSVTLVINVVGVKMDYRIDTKGYYQPVYVFECVIDDREDEIWIPAIK